MEKTTGLDAILGQDSAVGRLVQIIKNSTMPGAMLFAGPDGVGRRFAAILLAAAANCSDSADGCGRCGSCSRIASGNHPDVMILKPDGNFIKIGQIRSLIEKISTRPKEALTRFIIIDGASAMNAEASNALLKSLEEPPQNTVFVLIADSSMSLLPTIRSRCCHIGFSPLARNHVAYILKTRFNITHEEAEAAASMSAGSMKTALSATEKSWAGKRRWIYSEMAVLRNRSLSAVLSLAEAISSKPDDIRMALDIIQCFFRDLLVLKHTAEFVISQDIIPVLEKGLESFNEHDLVSILEDMHEARRNFDCNAVSRLTLEMLFLKISGFIK